MKTQIDWTRQTSSDVFKQTRSNPNFSGMITITPGRYSPLQLDSRQAAFWRQVHYIFKQLDGLLDGYNQNPISKPYVRTFSCTLLVQICISLVIFICIQPLTFMDMYLCVFSALVHIPNLADSFFPCIQHELGRRPRRFGRLLLQTSSSEPAASSREFEAPQNPNRLGLQLVRQACRTPPRCSIP
jgi:hypothetical protein